MSRGAELLTVWSQGAYFLCEGNFLGFSPWQWITLQRTVMGHRWEGRWWWMCPGAFGWRRRICRKGSWHFLELCLWAPFSTGWGAAWPVHWRAGPELGLPPARLLTQLLTFIQQVSSCGSSASPPPTFLLPQCCPPLTCEAAETGVSHHPGR